MPSESGSTVIAASKDEVWEVVSDVSRLGDWVTIHRGVKGSAPSDVEEGTSFTQQVSVAGHDFDVDWTACEVVPAERLVWQGDGPMGTTARSTYELSGSDGDVRFSYSTEFDVPGGKAGEMAGKAVQASSGNEAEESLERLKQIVEQ